MVPSNVVSIRSDVDIVAARMAARDAARAIGFGAIDQARIATATSELARNIVVYAGQGSVTISFVERDNRCGLQIVCNDQGPGIPASERLLQETNLLLPWIGVGIAGARRLMDDFELETTAAGTTVICRKWLRDGFTASPTHK